VQQQGPFPQQLQADGVGHVVAQVGPLIGPCAFSSLAASRDWLDSDMARAFTRAYTNARRFLNEAPAAEIAALEQSWFPHIDPSALQQCIASYQQLGCWTPHVEITRPALEVTLDVFEYIGAIPERYAYEQICAAPPAI
jgi:NitT/TauT family transport system substrate-binding protein